MKRVIFSLAILALIGINATLMRNYINGFKKPSKIREREIINAIHDIGKEYLSFGIA